MPFVPSLWTFFPGYFSGSIIISNHHQVWNVLNSKQVVMFWSVLYIKRAREEQSRAAAVHKKLALLFSRKLCLSQWRGSKWRVEGHETRCPMIARKIIIDQSFVIVFFTAKKQLSAYSMFWWGMAVKKTFSPFNIFLSFPIVWNDVLLSSFPLLTSNWKKNCQVCLANAAQKQAHKQVTMRQNFYCGMKCCGRRKPWPLPRKCKVSFESRQTPPTN